MEHSPNELPMVHTQLLATTGGTAQPVVRPAWNDAVVLKRLLDVGVQSFLISYVQTEEDTRRAVAATRFPPDGFRGFAATSRASGFGRIKDYHARAHEEICVLLQIETRLGLDDLEAITRVEGVDGIFVGSGDLSASLGYPGQLGHPEVQKVVEDAIARILACGKVAGTLTGDERLARRYIEVGCLFSPVGTDSAILARGAERLAARFKGKTPA